MAKSRRYSRQVQVMDLWLQGYRRSQIAEMLNISSSTVKKDVDEATKWYFEDVKLSPESQKLRTLVEINNLKTKIYEWYANFVLASQEADKMIHPNAINAFCSNLLSLIKLEADLTGIRKIESSETELFPMDVYLKAVDMLSEENKSNL